MPSFQNSNTRKKFENVMVAYVNYNTDFEVHSSLMTVWDGALTGCGGPVTVYSQRIAFFSRTVYLSDEEGIHCFFLPT